MPRPPRYATQEERDAARAASIAKYRESEKYKAARDRYYETKGAETAQKYYQDNKSKLLGYQSEWYWSNKTSPNAHYQIKEAAKVREAEYAAKKKEAEAKLKDERDKRNAEKKAARLVARKQKYIARLEKRKEERKVAAALKKAAQDNK
jgi:hypothetical protein